MVRLLAAGAAVNCTYRRLDNRMDVGELFELVIICSPVSLSSAQIALAQLDKDGYSWLLVRKCPSQIAPMMS